ncbi:guanine deaminase [Lelliottia amnigena]|jgi:guanine deaminase|uniref:guanine deaminase n=1 Tax=Lelliottia amnigena TaxID=61646 RepID=UPI00192B7DD8|nr:guanine deaminase [Lelliottia amnigena]MBL5922459.1 guanine deaminase [Lelliottia amnigena]MBM7355114.1 guanine deaminase [Lelliottia amnigena]MCE9965181.1 guanine deaminase [Lelliottia amnigena]QXB20886.1 guanine deaminase [Lelliottia amnigena]QXZ20104.1 guanine deaminase [Lelliottia amnigena]
MNVPHTVKPEAAIRGPVLTFTGDPFKQAPDEVMVYEPDGIVAFGGGKITHFGPAEVIEKQLPPDIEITNYGPDSLISAGFLDSHVHFPQTPMIGAFGEQLLDWLNTYTFPMERRYADKTFASAVAKMFLNECLKNGITTSCVYCTVYPQSVDALFEEADRLGMRIAGGKVMMDRNAPDYLLDTAQTSYEESKALIEKWHGHNRIMYAITPRFAPTSSPEQLAVAGALWDEYPDCYMQTHIAENLEEIEWVKSLFPERKGYLDVYDHYGLCRPRAVFGHGIHLTEDELCTMHQTGSAIAHCPTSNFFLGSGFFNARRAMQEERPVRVGIGTDLGAGTSFSMLTTLNEAYKAAQLNDYALTAAQAYYMATRGTAHAMYIDDKVGSIAPGMEADIVVLDMKSTPIIDYRMQFVKDIHEALFVQMTLGDDRAIQATYIAGIKRYSRG